MSKMSKHDANSLPREEKMVGRGRLQGCGGQCNRYEARNKVGGLVLNDAKMGKDSEHTEQLWRKPIVIPVSQRPEALR